MKATCQLQAKGPWQARLLRSQSPGLHHKSPHQPAGVGGLARQSRDRPVQRRLRRPWEVLAELGRTSQLTQRLLSRNKCFQQEVQRGWLRSNGWQVRGGGALCRFPGALPPPFRALRVHELTCGWAGGFGRVLTQVRPPFSRPRGVVYFLVMPIEQDQPWQPTRFLPKCARAHRLLGKSPLNSATLG